MSAVRFENGIRWDGNRLSVWATVNGSRIFCEIPRSTIYNVQLFDDGITREIARDRAEIFCAGGTKKRWRFDSVDVPRIEADFQVWRDQRDWTAEKYRCFDRHEPMPPDCRASG